MALNNVGDLADALDDNALFAAATAPDPAPAEPTAGAPEGGEQQQQPPQQTVTEGEPVAPPIDGQALPDQAAPQEEFVPSWRLREEREAREGYASRLAERERQLTDALNYIRSAQQAAAPPAPPPPDPLVDPAGFNRTNAEAFATLANSFENRLRTVQLENNLQLTRVQVGPELFDAAYAAFIDTASGDQTFARAIVGSGNPGAAMVNWYTQAATLQRIGPDPDAWIAQQREELLQDPEFLAQAVEAARNYRPPSANVRAAPPQPSSNVTVLPPSLMRMRGAGSTETTAANFGGDNNPLSDESLFAFATKQK